jgi:hypothetical protein
MFRKAVLAFVVFGLLSVFGGPADSVLADGGGGTSYIPPRCC